MSIIEIAGIVVKVTKKNIRNIHLAVYPPEGKVTLACPETTQDETIRLYLTSKIGWIRRQRKVLEEKERQSPREYVSRETHYFLGKAYLLKVISTEGPYAVEVGKKFIVMHVHPNTSKARREELMREWYRAELKKLLTGIIEKWEKKMELRLDDWQVRQMKTKWGSCNPKKKHILLNLELAKKPVHCIEYIVVHELVHLLERTHNEHFVALMDRYLPNWKRLRDELNKLPVSHVEWGY